MTLLSRKADYALLILSHLHHHATEGGNARAIAERFKLGRPFVANILKELCQKGFVTSTRGVKGGYLLAKSAQSITLAELLGAIEDGFQLTLCSENQNVENRCEVADVCTIKGPMADIQRRLMGLLQSVTLADLFNGNSTEMKLIPKLSVLPSHEHAHSPSQA